MALSGDGARTGRVEVRSRFDGSWCPGFEIAGTKIREDGTRWFRVRRVSDAEVLPSWFSADDLASEPRR